MPTGDRTATHPVVREKVQEMLDKEDKDFGGVLSHGQNGADAVQRSAGSAEHLRQRFHD